MTTPPRAAIGRATRTGCILYQKIDDVRDEYHKLSGGRRTSPESSNSEKARVPSAKHVGGRRQPARLELADTSSSESEK